MGKIIHFEDNGQDFLTWYVDKLDKVVRCEPFQGDIWEGSQILTKNLNLVGRNLFLRTPNGPSVLELVHKVIKVEDIPDRLIFTHDYSTSYPKADAAH